MAHYVMDCKSPELNDAWAHAASHLGALVTWLDVKVHPWAG